MKPEYLSGQRPKGGSNPLSAAERQHLPKRPFHPGKPVWTLSSQMRVLNSLGIGIPYLVTAEEIALKTGRQPIDVLIEAGVITAALAKDARRQIERQTQADEARLKMNSHLLNQAISNLEETYPALSAKRVVTRPQVVVFMVIIIALAIAMWVIPQTTITFLAMCGMAFYIASVSLKGAILASFDDRSRPLKFPELSVPDTRLPVYTVLVALYRESNQVSDLVAHLSRLDWPHAKLEIKLVCEADDRETLDNLARLKIPPFIEVVLVPKATPRTKPKALNYTLPLCTGEYLVLYDAEDRPHPQQLKEAYSTFLKEPENMACLQAPLRIHNSNQTLLTRMFAIEYLTLFNGILPVLGRWRMPMPLGGTSNHFKMDALRSVGSWDPYNVTEDADLGIRLARNGYFCSTITLPTYEEAPPKWTAWKTQRTRWLKGWMQTILVHSREPLQLIADMGFKRALFFHLFLTAIVLSALAHPVLVVVTIGSIISILGEANSISQLFVAGLGLAVLVGGYTTHALLSLAVLKTHGKQGKAAWLVVLPFYWLLISYTGWRALAHLLYRPHVWEKTPHGLSAKRFESTSVPPLLPTE